MLLLRVFLLLGLVGLTAGEAMAVAAKAKKPNIVFILADDLGWYDVGFRNPLMPNATHIGRLLETEAALLERHYVFKFCSPTRRSFLAGRLPVHNGVDNGESAAVDLRMTTIATKLKKAGYATGQAGKWHCGHTVVAQTPLHRGFDTSLGYFQGAEDHISQKGSQCKAIDLWDTDRPGVGKNGTFGDLMYVQRAVDTITNHDSNAGPLFFYLALQVAHAPMEAPDRFKKLYNKSCPSVVEYAMSTVVDEAVKNVTDALKATGMWENTFLVFSADNGGPAFSDQRAASNYPLRGGKYTSWEGGIRATAFVSGGLLPAKMRGKNISAPIHVCDWYATFAHLAGADPKDDHDGVPSIDSLNQWPIIQGQQKPVRTEVYPIGSVLIQNNWKLIVGGQGNSAKWSGPLFPKVPATGPKSINCSNGCLFDVVKDPSERDDVAAQNPKVLANMTARLTVLRATIWKPTYPKVKFTCNKTTENHGYLTPVDWVKPTDLLTETDLKTD